MVNSAIIPLNEVDVTQDPVRKLNLIEYLVGVYDYQGREKTEKGKSYQILPASAVMMGGQEQVWHLDAFASRCIVQTVPPEREVRTAEQKDLFEELLIICNEGVSHLIAPIFQARGIMRGELNQMVSHFKSHFLKLDIKNVTSRMIYNFAMIISPLIVLIRNKVIEYPMTEQEIIKHFEKALAWQSKKLLQEGVLEVLFQFIASEYGHGKKLNHQNVFKTTVNGRQVLRIRTQQIVPLFISYVRREGLRLENIQKSEIIARLEKHPAFIQKAKGLQVGYKITGAGHIANDLQSRPIPYRPGSYCIEMDVALLGDFELPEIAWTDNERGDQEDEQLTNSIFANAN